MHSPRSARPSSGFGWLGHFLVSLSPSSLPPFGDYGGGVREETQRLGIMDMQGEAPQRLLLLVTIHQHRDFHRKNSHLHQTHSAVCQAPF